MLVRHAFAGSNRDGTASSTVPGEGLTAEGVAQARLARELLTGDEIALGVASELARTQETLDLVLADRAVPRLVVPEFNEIDFGSFDGGLLSSYRAWAASHSPMDAAPGGGESRAQVAARYAHGLRTLLARPERSMLLVGHALALRYVLDAARGLVPATVMAPVEHATPFRMAGREVEAAARLLEVWSTAPRFRDRSPEG